MCSTLFTGAILLQTIFHSGLDLLLLLCNKWPLLAMFLHKQVVIVFREQMLGLLCTTSISEFEKNENSRVHIGYKSKEARVSGAWIVTYSIEKCNGVLKISTKIPTILCAVSSTDKIRQIRLTWQIQATLITWPQPAKCESNMKDL